MRVGQIIRTVGRRLWFFLAILGPGLITASADNDAAGIATYSLAGSTYGYQFLWLIVAVTFGEVVVQEMAARMGVVTGKDTADLVRERFGVRVTAFAMLCLLVANLGTTVAQFAGVAAAGELFGISRLSPSHWRRCWWVWLSCAAHTGSWKRRCSCCVRRP